MKREAIQRSTDHRSYLGSGGRGQGARNKIFAGNMGSPGRPFAAGLSTHSVYEKVSSQSSAVPPIVRNGIHAVAITQSFLLQRVKVSRVRWNTMTRVLRGSTGGQKKLNG